MLKELIQTLICCTLNYVSQQRIQILSFWFGLFLALSSVKSNILRLPHHSDLLSFDNQANTILNGRNIFYIILLVVKLQYLILVHYFEILRNFIIRKSFASYVF